jgi:hypothetical protein
MSTRDILTAIVLGALGILAAASIAAFASNITGEDIGLDSEPVSVIPADGRSLPAPAPGPKERGDDRGDAVELGDDDGGNSGPGGGDDDSSGPGSGEVEREPGDDNDGDNSGSGSSSSGSGSSGSGGSDSSGSGSSGSGSSGSDSSGSGGGDDRPEPDDD